MVGLHPDSGLVFVTAKGKPLNATVVYGLFRKIVEDAGLPRQRFHDLRHACATLLLAQGVHPRLVMEQLGHFNIGVTMNCYSHVIDQLQREPAAQMDALLGNLSQA